MTRKPFCILLCGLAIAAAAACGDGTEQPGAETTRFADAVATSHHTPTGIQTTLTDLSEHTLAVVEYDVIRKEAAISLPEQGMTRSISLDSEPTLADANEAAHAAYQVSTAGIDPSQRDWEDWCVFCSWSEEYQTIYCYFVPFCCGWPYDTC